MPAALSGLGESGTPVSTVLVTPEGLRETTGVKLPLLEAMPQLAALPVAALGSLPGSTATWAPGRMP